MAPLKLLLLAALTVGAAALPDYRGATGQYNVVITREPNKLQQQRIPSKPQASSDSYQCFQSDLSQAVSPRPWLAFEPLWHINEQIILSKNGGNTYIEHYIKDAILQVSEESNIDARLLLAIMMQESNGKAGMQCKSHSTGENRCGLMQIPDGRTFDETDAKASILEMMRESINGDHLDRALDSDYRYISDVTNRLLGWNGRGEGYRACEL